ncbi:response regulator transcription factor [Paenibacillus thalictri]|uniref:Response regulator n=1 Tax=Paenibacillus thalictri TaxID=2527873 RepID=A0A4Q9DXW5_9BACL|nr:response regulator [Paenibacillus thalictri]TBL80713.1 response regulator [Paenibacillus thalictri]
MYKVLIADDEMIVRVGLKSFIEWEQIGFTLCGEAGNGEEALALCEQLAPDVVLTDIRMPKMDGIAFIEQALKRWPDLKIVVLSCVNEFDVLQQAFRLGVNDYFLKLSFNPENLIGILEKVGKELDQLRAAGKGAAEPAVQAEEPLQPEQAVLKEHFYRIAVRDKHQTLKLGGRLKLRIAPGEHIAMSIRGDRPYRLDKNDPKLRGHLLKYSVINIVEEVLGREVATDVVELDEDEYLAVCAVGDGWNNESTFLLAKEIQHSLLRFLNYSVSIGIGERMNMFQHFYAGYSQSASALEQKFYHGHGSIQFYPDSNPAGDDAAADNRLGPLSAMLDEKAMAADLDSFAFEKVRITVLECIESIKTAGAWPAEDVKSYFTEWVIPWLRMYKSYDGSAKESHDRSVSPFEQIHSLETLEDMRNWYIDYTIRMEELIRQLSKGLRSREEIEKAKRYVERHYADEISIVDVAQHIGLNSTYFSHLFKKETGEGFSEFLTHYRLTKAQLLLRDSSKNITEISEEVGYNDVAYFRKIFRGQLQMTPSEYRAQFTRHGSAI